MPMQMVAMCAATLGACESRARSSLKSNLTIAWRAASDPFIGPRLAGYASFSPDAGMPGVAEITANKIKNNVVAIRSTADGDEGKDDAV